MNKKTNTELQVLVEKATSGDKSALETLIAGVQDIVFNLSLRMLGTFADAEDATQDILLKIITHLSSFRGDSSFTTWVFRIAANHLKNNLAEELKMSCTNVMLQCLDTESRCIFILGTMFKLDSRIAGGILEITPEAYRKRLSRIRKKMADFLSEYCGEYGGGRCKCKNRLNYAIQSHRLNPLQLDYTTAAEIPIQTIIDVKNAMEDIDDLSQDFSFCKTYQSPERMKHLIQELLDSKQLSIIQNS